MRFQILVAIALVARISSLREEVTRFDLEVQEKAQEVQTTARHVPLKEPLPAPTVEREGRPLDERVQEPIAIPAETEGFVEVATQKLNQEPLELTAESCIKGVITVTGKVVVRNKLKFPKECNVLRGEPNSQVTLEEPLEFEGNLSFEGHLDFTATTAFQRACVTVSEHATIVGDVQFQNCKNEKEDWGEGGGGLFVGGALVQRSGSAVFRNCRARYNGGGARVSEDVTQEGGTMEFRNCSSERGGGGLSAFWSVTQRNGAMSFEACHSGESGGGLLALSVTQHSGAMSFEACHSGVSGGGAFVGQDVTQEGGTMEFRNCSSKAKGGGAFVKQDVTQEGGTMEFRNCSSEEHGGGLYVESGGGAYVFRTVTQEGGTMEFHNCSSKADGGGLYVLRGSVTKRNGTMSFEACHSGRAGGGAFVKQDVTQEGGTMEFRNCSSKASGGGLYVLDSVTQRNGAMSFEACHSGESGGGARVSEDVTQEGGTMEFRNCSSKAHGGGASVGEDVTQEGGTMEFRNCSSEADGGGMVATKKFSQAGAALFDRCIAKDDGGGLWVGVLEQATKGVLSFSHCSGTRGGGLYTQSVHSNATETLRFHRCEAIQSGGGIQIVGKEGSFLGSVILETCSAARGTAIEARNLTVQKLVLVDTFQKAIDAQSLHIANLTFTVKESSADGVKPELAIEAVNMTIASAVNCTPLKSCEFISSSPPSIRKLLCPVGTGVPKRAAYGCLACPEGYTQIEAATSGSCVACPNGTALCRAAKIRMGSGLMIHNRNLGRPLHCPSKAACQGGELPENEDLRMCQPGYDGEGCTQCTNSNGILYLTADSSVLACTRCADTAAIQVLQWSSFLAQRSVLFAVSAASIFGAGHANAVKSSGVYLNQLMAFAAVSGSVVTVVMQTDTAQKMKFAAVQYLFGTAVFLSEAGSGQGSRSSHCLLSYISLEKTGLHGVHSLDVVIATSLVLLLSSKDFRVALVAGINCFLPGILADFAKYAVCYSLEEESSGNQKMRCDNLPFHNVSGFVLVGGGFLAIFAVALFVWIRLSTSNAKGEEVPSHVAFLTNKYKDGCRYFEAERLVRKILLTTAAAFWPSSVYPELQMTALLVITTASILMYSIFQPYSRYFWNWSEFALLGTALLLISLASAVLGNEQKWDKTDLGQKSMIVSLGAIVTGICAAFMFKIALEVWGERRPTAAPAS